MPPTGDTYTDNGDGTITDTKTGLMWEKKSDDGTVHDWNNTYTWSTGAPWNNTGTVFTTFLSTINAGGGFAGHTDWRLPNVAELQSIQKQKAFDPATYPAFNTLCAPGCTVLKCSCTVSSLYWSSSSVPNIPQFAWVVKFLTSNVTHGGDKTKAFYVRAVRAGS